MKRQLTLVRRNAHREIQPRGKSAGAASLPLDLQIYAEHPDSLWVRAWDLTERLLIETREEARRAGADFLLVSISNGVQESAEARRNRPNWNGWVGRSGISMDWPETRLEKFSRQHGIEYLPLLPAFRAEAERTGRPLHIAWTGHWNSAGHALAARVIGARIEQHLGREADRPQGAPPR